MVPDFHPPVLEGERRIRKNTVNTICIGIKKVASIIDVVAEEAALLVRSARQEQYSLGEANKCAVNIVSDEFAGSAVQQPGRFRKKCAAAASGITQGQPGVERQQTGHRAGNESWREELARALSETATDEILIPDGKTADGLAANTNPREKRVNLPVMRD